MKLEKMRKTVLPKLHKILDDAYDYGKLHGLTPAEIRVLSLVYGDLLFENQSKFLQKGIADVLKKCGVPVKMSRDGVNYHACLLDD